MQQSSDDLGNIYYMHENNIIFVWWNEKWWKKDLSSGEKKGHFTDDDFCVLTGSSHSDKEVDLNTPEKVPRTTSERKRKRKVDDTGGGPGSNVNNKITSRTVASLENKKANDYFPKHHVGSSPIRHGGAKSPSPQQGYPMVSQPKVLKEEHPILSETKVRDLWAGFIETKKKELDENEALLAIVWSKEKIFVFSIMIKASFYFFF